MTDIICDEFHHYWLNEGTVEVPGVTQILQAQGISDFSMVPEKLLEINTNFGKATHQVCQYWDKGTLDMKSLQENEKTRDLIPYLEQWQKFLRDYSVKLDPNFIECIVYCQKFKFAGTPDRVCIINGKNIVLDIKTGASNPSHAIQLAAYQLALKEEGLKIHGRWGIYLSMDKYKIEVFKNPSDTSVFLSALNIWNWKKNKKNGG